MPGTILQLNFTFAVTPDEYKQAVAPLAPDFAAVDGLRWKVWLMSEERREAGGLYLFDDEALCRAFLDGPLAGAVRQHPALANLSAKTFDVVDDLTAITRGPISAGASI